MLKSIFSLKNLYQYYIRILFKYSFIGYLDYIVPFQNPKSKVLNISEVRMEEFFLYLIKNY